MMMMTQRRIHFNKLKIGSTLANAHSKEEEEAHNPNDEWTQHNA